MHIEYLFDNAVGGFSIPSTPKVFNTTDFAVYTHIVQDGIVNTTQTTILEKQKQVEEFVLEQLIIVL
jgi:hypothetical protein